LLPPRHCLPGEWRDFPLHSWVMITMDKEMETGCKRSFHSNKAAYNASRFVG
jgi:hypothetical protein